MGLRALPLSSSSHNAFGVAQTLPRHHHSLIRSSKFVVVNSAKEPQKKSKQSLFSSVAEALDFSQVRSAEDAQLLEAARDTTQSGGRMSREQVHACKNPPMHSFLSFVFFPVHNNQVFWCHAMQYGALRRKIGGTYKDFFKSYVDGNQ